MDALCNINGDFCYVTIIQRCWLLLCYWTSILHDNFRFTLQNSQNKKAWNQNRRKSCTTYLHYFEHDNITCYAVFPFCKPNNIGMLGYVHTHVRFTQWCQIAVTHHYAIPTHVFNLHSKLVVSNFYEIIRFQSVFKALIKARESTTHTSLLRK